MAFGEYISIVLKAAKKTSSLFIFATAVAASSSCIGLAIGARVDYATFGEGAETYCPWLLVAAVTFFVLALFKFHVEKNSKTVELVPTGIECFAHVATQPDKRKFTQIGCYLDVFNLTDGNIWLTQIKIVKPRTSASYVHRMILVQEQNGRYSGGYVIPPRGKTDGSGHIMLDTDIVEKIKKKGVVLKIADQYGHWHTLNLPNVKIA